MKVAFPDNYLPLSRNRQSLCHLQKAQRPKLQSLHNPQNHPLTPLQVTPLLHFLSHPPPPPPPPVPPPPSVGFHPQQAVPLWKQRESLFEQAFQLHRFSK